MSSGYRRGRRLFQVGLLKKYYSRSAANLLQSLDQFLLLEYIDGMSNLIASQDWSSYPARFISLLSALGQFPFSVKLRNHLRFFPFSDAADLAVRFQIVERLLKTDVADEYVDDWKQMFHSKLNAAWVTSDGAYQIIVVCTYFRVEWP